MENEEIAFQFRFANVNVNAYGGWVAKGRSGGWSVKNGAMQNNKNRRIVIRKQYLRNNIDK